MGQAGGWILTDLAPGSLAAAVEQSLTAWMPLFGKLGEYREDAPPGVRRAIAPGCSEMFNGLSGTLLEPEEADAAIRWTVEDARRRGTPLMWWTGPLTRPADMGSRLEAHGFRLDEDAPGMAVPLRALNEDIAVPAGLSIRRAQDEAELRDWADVLYAAWRGGPVKDYENEAWLRVIRATDPEMVQPYVAYLEGRPVANSLLLLAEGVAGIYAVGTQPEMRGRGTGAAVTLRPLLEARRIGYQAGVLFSSEMGFHVYRRLGFEEVCRIRAYVWRPGGEG